MNQSTISVYHSSGSPASGAKVQLSFSNGGVTSAFRTNSRGVATVSHSATGSAKLIINGSAKGTYRFPGNYSVTL